MSNILSTVSPALALCSNAFAPVPSLPVNPPTAASTPLKLALREAMERAAIAGGPGRIKDFAMHLKPAEAGEVTVLEVVDAPTTPVQARNAYDDGMLRYRMASANLQTITGAF